MLSENQFITLKIYHNYELKKVEILNYSIIELIARLEQCLPCLSDD